MSIIVNIKERADKGLKKYVEANPFWQAIYYCFLKFAADETPIFKQSPEHEGLKKRHQQELRIIMETRPTVIADGIGIDDTYMREIVNTKLVYYSAQMTFILEMNKTLPASTVATNIKIRDAWKTFNDVKKPLILVSIQFSLGRLPQWLSEEAEINFTFEHYMNSNPLITTRVCLWSDEDIKAFVKDQCQNFHIYMKTVQDYICDADTQPFPPAVKKIKMDQDDE
jgi:hypothetical protein